MAFTRADDAIVIIPARMASSRFPGKPLAMVRGPDGVERSLIEHSWRAAAAAAGAADVVVATDDVRIAEAVAGFGGAVAMTGVAARNGSERVHEALVQLGRRPQLVVNWQGDAPLIPTDFLAVLAESWRGQRCAVLTPAMVCDARHTAMLLDDWRGGVVGGTCVVTDADGDALYFSKSPLPSRPTAAAPMRLHVGLYAYTPDALDAYVAALPSVLEEAEGLEQLRFLDLGMPVRVVDVAVPEGGLWEVNNPEDIAIVEAAWRQRASV